MTKKSYLTFGITLGSLVLTLLLIGCARKVLIKLPPRIDLLPYQTMGVIEFSSNSTDKLNQFATQKFISVIQRAQPGTHFLELGSKEQLLKSTSHNEINPEVMKIIGKKYNVATVFTGSFEVSEPQRSVSFSKDLSSLYAGSSVEISLTLKHWDTESGATIWTNSRSIKKSLAKIKKRTGQPMSFRFSLSEDKYSGVIAKLVNKIASDFRTRYEERVIVKE
ncbi:MAG: hypothetical protein NG712_00035 [Omnitrophica bacterium]|nr:hypothetical protein [Candidatus Omnitrophota bacterium]